MDINKICSMQPVYGYKQKAGTDVYLYDGITPKDYADACNLISENGCEKISDYTLGSNSVREYKKDGEYISAMYFASTEEMKIVCEADSAYLNFTDIKTDFRCDSEIIHIALEDYGLSYVVKLGDGRFIVIDGGFEFEIEADKLMNCLKEKSPFEKPIIAAWIMTHPHVDHYRCFFWFEKKYINDVVIESFIYNFPDVNMSEPALDSLFEHEIAEKEHIIRFENIVEQMGTVVYRAHSGQVYDISNAHIEILSSPDDVFHQEITEYNMISLIFRMTLEGQTILWCGDAYYKQARLGQRWGTYLKSDILQVPHHGFCGGEPEEYDLINPDVCLWPIDVENGYVKIDEYQPNSNYLMHNVAVKEHVFSDKVVSLKMPYTPNPNGVEIHRDKMERARRSIGATSWYFDDLSKEECEFTFIVSCLTTAQVYADLFFDYTKEFVQNIKITLKPYCRNKINLFNPDDADPNAMPYERGTLAAKGMPEGKRFAVHFKSDVPFIVTGCKKEVYHD